MKGPPPPGWGSKGSQEDVETAAAFGLDEWEGGLGMEGATHQDKLADSDKLAEINALDDDLDESDMSLP
jgi:hypothetical protein